MVHGKYIKRGGKLHGPYYYQSVRGKDGKIHKVYLGKNYQPGDEKQRQRPHLAAILIPLLLICGLSFFVLKDVTLQSVPITGNVVFDVYQTVSAEAYIEVDGVAQPLPAKVEKHAEGEYGFNISTLNVQLSKGEHTVRILDQGEVVYEAVITIGKEQDNQGIGENATALAHNQSAEKGIGENVSVIARERKEGNESDETILINETVVQVNVTDVIVNETVALNNSVVNETNNTFIVNVSNVSVEMNGSDYDILEEKTIGEVRVLQNATWVRKIRIKKDKDVDVVLPDEAEGARVFAIENATRERKEQAFERDESRVRLKNVKKDELFDIEFETPGPLMFEMNLSAHTKRVVVASDLNFTNVTAFTTLPAQARKESVRIHWLEEGTVPEISRYVDADNDSRIDGIEWVVPHLSNQTFDISITVLNVYTYLRDNETWTVNFNTTGAANLTITPVQASFTEFLTDDPTTLNELQFVRLQCGMQDLSPGMWVNTTENVLMNYSALQSVDQVVAHSLVYQNYSCEGTGNLTTFVFKAGYAVLEFNFGGEIAYAIDPVRTPTAYPGSTVQLRAQACSKNNAGTNPLSFTAACSGTYPNNSCASGGDRLGCDDNIIEEDASTGGPGEFSGVNASFFNATIADCLKITQVRVCHNLFFGGSDSVATANVTVARNNGVTVSLAYSTSLDLDVDPGLSCQDVTANFSWVCSDFFGPAGPRATATAQIRSGDFLGAVGKVDVLFYNVTYEAAHSVLLNSTNILSNDTLQNLTAIVTGQSTDTNSYAYSWRVNGTSITLLNIPMTDNASSSDQQTIYDFSGFNALVQLGRTPQGDTNEPLFNKTGGPDKNGAYVFDGINDFINVSHSLAISPVDAWTIDYWIYLARDPDCDGNNNWRWLYTKGAPEDFQGGVFEDILEQNRIILTRFILSNGTVYGRGTTGKVEVGRWTHVVETYNSRSGKFRQYLNGSLDGEAIVFPAKNMTVRTSPLYINAVSSMGAGSACANGNGNFNGSIASFKLYNRSLTPEQVGQNYFGGLTGYNVTVQNETFKGENWSVGVTPLNSSGWNGTTAYSNNVLILGSPPENNTLTTPANDSFFNYNSIFLNWTSGNDNDTDVLTYFLYLNGTLSNGTTNLNVTQILPDGYYTWGVLVGDGQANSSTFSNNRTFTVDTTQSRTVFISPTELNNTFRNAQDFVVVNVSIYDLRALWNITFTIVNTSFFNQTTYQMANNQTGNTSFNWSRLSANSRYLYNVTVYDRAGNVNVSEERTITLDNTQPRTILIAPIATDGSTNTISVNVSLFEANPDNITFWLFNRTGIVNQTLYTLSSNTTNVSVNFTGLNTTTHRFTYNVTVYDRAGNLNVTETRTITLNFPPSITSVILNSTNLNTNDTSQNLTAYPQGASDPDGDSVSYNYNWRVNGTSVTLLNVPMTDNASSSDGRTVFDFSGYNNFGALGSTVANDVAKPVFQSADCPGGGGCYRFDGADYINFSRRQSLNFSSSFSVEAWVNVSSFCNTVIGRAASPDNGQFLLNTGESANPSAVSCVYGADTGRFNFGIINQSGSFSEHFSPMIFRFREYHVVAVYNLTNAVLYMNGSFVNSTNTQGFGFIQYNTTHDLFMGGLESGTFNGTIGQVRLYNYSLTPEQVGALYQNRVNNVTVAQETFKGQNWSVAVTPIDSEGWNGTTVLSNNVTILNSPPENNSLTFPENNSYFNYNSIFLNWTSSNDNDTDLLTYFVYLNRTLSNGTTNLNVTQVLPEGYYEWSILVGDGQANSSTFSNNRTFTVDTTQARTLFIAPTEANNTFRNAQSFVIMNVSVFELWPLQNITFVVVNNSFANVSFFVLSDNRSNMTLNVIQLSRNSQYIYNVTTYDLAGNFNTTETRTITLDDMNPRTLFLNPTEENNTFRTWDWVLVNLSMYDVNLGNVTFGLRNGTFSNSTVYALFANGANATNATLNFTGLSPNSQYIYNATVYDLAGNVNISEERMITLDNTQPRVVFIAPTEANNTFRRTNTIIVNASVFDMNLANVTFGLRNGTFSNSTAYALFANGANGTNSTLNFSSLSGNSQYLYNVTTYDLAGNVNRSEVRTITFDTVNPETLFIAPTEANNTFRTWDWIIVNTSMFDMNPANITFLLFNETELANKTVYTVTKNETNMSLNFTGLPRQRYLYNVTVFDLAGNSNVSETRTITLDNTQPRTIFIAPTEANNTFRNPEIPSVIVNMSVYDMNLANITFGLRNDTFSNSTVYYLLATGANATANVTFNFTQLSPNSQYIYNATVYDLAGNVNRSEERVVTFDTVNPRTLFLNPTEENNTFRTWDGVLVNLSMYDVNLGNVTFGLRNGTFSNSTVYALFANGANGTNATLNFTGLSPNSQYIYNATVYDLAGNVNRSEERVITLDNTDPRVAMEGTNDSFLAHASFMINASIYDANPSNITFVFVNSSGYGNVSLNYLLTSDANRTGNVTFNFSYLDPNGKYLYNITVYDQAGNRNTTETWTVTLDNVIPVLTAFSSSAGLSYTQGTTTTVSCAMTDANAESVMISIDGEGTICTGVDICSGSYAAGSSGTKTVQCVGEDKAGNNIIDTLTITVNAAAGGGGGGSGGGGGGGGGSSLKDPILPFGVEIDNAGTTIRFGNKTEIKVKFSVNNETGIVTPRVDVSFKVGDALKEYKNVDVTYIPSSLYGIALVALALVTTMASMGGDVSRLTQQQWQVLRTTLSGERKRMVQFQKVGPLVLRPQWERGYGRLKANEVYRLPEAKQLAELEEEVKRVRKLLRNTKVDVSPVLKMDVPQRVVSQEQPKMAEQEFYAYELLNEIEVLELLVVEKEWKVAKQVLESTQKLFETYAPYLEGKYKGDIQKRLGIIREMLKKTKA